MIELQQSSETLAADDWPVTRLGITITPSAGLAPQQIFYSALGQVIEEHSSNPDTGGMQVSNQYVWSLTYVNALLVRDWDADGNSATGNLGISGSGLDQRVYAE